MCWFHGCYHGRQTSLWHGEYDSRLRHQGTLTPWPVGCDTWLSLCPNVYCDTSDTSSCTHMVVSISTARWQQPACTGRCRRPKTSARCHDSTVTPLVVLNCERQVWWPCSNNLWPLSGRYIPRETIHEINTWKCPIQTQCGQVIYSPFMLNIG